MGKNAAGGRGTSQPPFPASKQTAACSCYQPVGGAQELDPACAN